MTMTILEAIDDPNLFGPWFKNPASWAAWRVFLKAVFALRMDSAEFQQYRRLTNRIAPPSTQVEEAWLVVGRRGGKSFITSLIAVYLACFRDYTPYLQPGERATVMILAADRKQARVILRYVTALLQGVPMLAKMIENETAESIDLTNRVSIEIHSASLRSVRGYTVIAALCDEISFWRSEDSANPDREILTALRPAMATIPGSMLLGLSSPYRRSGVLWEAYRDNFGQDRSDVLVVQADSRTMNPGLPESVVQRAYREDPATASAEFGAEFRSDLSGFLEPGWIDRATRPEACDLPPQLGPRYVAFADPSGGRHDAFTLGIAHAEGTRLILDLVRERKPPFDPQGVVREYAGLLRRYSLSFVTGDRYGGEWVGAAFRDHGIAYHPSDKSKSEIYLEVEPAFATGRVEIPAHPTLLQELRQLERRTARGSRDSVDHPLRGHDDSANSACGALWQAALSCSCMPADFVEGFIAGNQELRIPESERWITRMYR